MKVGEWRYVVRDPIDFVAVHQKQRAQLLGNLNSNPSQICARGRIVPKLTKLIFSSLCAPAH